MTDCGFMLVEYFKSEHADGYMKLASIVPRKKPFFFGTVKMGNDPFYYLEFPLFTSILPRNRVIIRRLR